MKNITLSIPEDLLQRSRAYAERHGTSLNELVRQLLRQAVSPPTLDPINRLIEHSRRLQIETLQQPWNRAELYDRKVFS